MSTPSSSPPITPPSLFDRDLIVPQLHAFPPLPRFPPPPSPLALLSLPEELLRESLTYLTVKDILAFRAVCCQSFILTADPLALVTTGYPREKLIPTSTIITFASDTLQILDLSYCAIDDTCASFLLSVCPHLQYVDLTGCRQITDLTAPPTSRYHTFSCSGTGISLSVVRALATQTQYLNWTNTPAMYEFFSLEANQNIHEMIMQLSISNLEENLPLAVTRSLPLLQQKGTKSHDVVAAALARQPQSLHRVLLDAPLDAQLHTLLMACTMAVPNDDESSGVLAKILRLGADVNATTLQGLTPLHLACCLGKSSTVRFLANQKGVDINSGDGKDQGTPLHSATLAGHEGCVMELINCGCGVNVKDSQSNTPCHYAAVLNLPGILRLLCEHGADCTLLSQGESLAALNIAAGNGYDEVVSILLKTREVSLDEGVGKKGGTALHYAVANGRVGIVEALLEAGADPNAVDDHGYMPLYFASVVGHHAMIRLLIRFGASIHACARTPLSPLQLACAEGHLETAALLISLGADVNEHDGIALRLATVNNDIMMVQYLLGVGCDPTRCDEKGYSCLHLACTRGHLGIVHLLCISGANPYQSTESGLLPLHCAAAAEHYKAVSLLCQRYFFPPTSRKVLFPTWRAEVDIRFVEGVQDEEEEQDDDDEDLASCNPWSRRVAIATADRIYMSKPLDSPTNGISRRISAAFEINLKTTRILQNHEEDEEMCLEFLQVGDEEEDEDEGEEEPVSGCGEINDGQQEASEKDADGYSKKKDKRVVLWLRAVRTPPPAPTARTTPSPISSLAHDLAIVPPPMWHLPLSCRIAVASTIITPPSPPTTISTTITPTTTTADELPPPPLATTSSNTTLITSPSPPPLPLPPFQHQASSSSITSFFMQLLHRKNSGQEKSNSPTSTSNNGHHDSDQIMENHNEAKISKPGRRRRKQVKNEERSNNNRFDSELNNNDVVASDDHNNANNKRGRHGRGGRRSNLRRSSSSISEFWSSLLSGIIPGSSGSVPSTDPR